VRSGAEEAGRDRAAVRIVCRGAVKVRPAGDPDRVPLTGSVDEIRADFAELAAHGVDEVFVDLNFDPQIGTPDAEESTSMRRAEEALDAFAPGR
jgi:hypothetical protein